MNKQERLDQDGVTNPVLFYSPRHVQWGSFSNFSNHSIRLPNPFTGFPVLYKTSEHRYQAMKATNNDDHLKVAAPTLTPSQSKDAGKSIVLRDGWGNDYGDLCWYVMVEALLAKYKQNRDFRIAIASSVNRHIYEDSPVDDIWGWRYSTSYTGKNLLGRALMYVREVKS